MEFMTAKFDKPEPTKDWVPVSIDVPCPTCGKVYEMTVLSDPKNTDEAKKFLEDRQAKAAQQIEESCQECNYFNGAHIRVSPKEPA